MRKIFVALLLGAVALTTTYSAKAQGYQNAVGVKLGTYSGINYKLFLSRTEAIDAVFTFGNNTIGVAGSYLWHFPIAEVPQLRWYVGAGGHLILISGYNRLWNDYDNNHKSDSNIALGANGSGGIEYTFPKIPLNIGAELGPYVNLFDETRFNAHVGIFARYTF